MRVEKVYFAREDHIENFNKNIVKSRTSYYYGLDKLKPGDYVFFALNKGAKKIPRVINKICKFERQYKDGDSYYTQLELVNEFKPISTGDFAKLTIFKLSTDLINKTVNSNTTKNPITLELTNEAAANFEENIKDKSYFNNLEFRKIFLVRDKKEKKSEKDIQLFFNGDVFELFNKEAEFLGEIREKFNPEYYKIIESNIKKLDYSTERAKIYIKLKQLETLVIAKTEEIKKLRFEEFYNFFCVDANKYVEDRIPEIEYKASLRDDDNDLSKTSETKPKHSDDLNLIFYGPPGTGKTYNTYKKAVEIVKKKEINDSVASFEKVKKMFDTYCKVDEEDETDEKENQQNKKENKRIEFITFHQSYSYEDFIEGYKPKEEGGNISFKLKSGVFKKFCEIASNDLEHNYCFIIDEINRGNVSKIFGELITLIEPSKREGNKESLSCKLTYSNKPFSVPNNVFIIGTMNTADRSLVQLDAALRRRFKFIEMMPNYKLLEEKVKDVEGINIRQMLESINDRISAYLDREHQIGHTYFLKLEENNTLEALNDIFFKEIIPLLQEYFFGEYDTICKILKETNDDGVFVTKRTIDKIDVYDIQTSTKTENEYIAAYKKIYESNASNEEEQ